jgi:hypothetical protein
MWTLTWSFEGDNFQGVNLAFFPSINDNQTIYY